jgi:hypothetical protein
MSDKVIEALKLFKNASDDHRFNALKSSMTLDEREELREGMKQIIIEYENREAKFNNNVLWEDY